MSSPSRDDFHISLEELVQSAHVPVEDQISEHELPGAVMPQPDVNIQNTIIWAAGSG